MSEHALLNLGTQSGTECDAQIHLGGFLVRDWDRYRPTPASDSTELSASKRTLVFCPLGGSLPSIPRRVYCASKTFTDEHGTQLQGWTKLP